MSTTLAPIFHCQLSPGEGRDTLAHVVECVRQFTLEANFNCTSLGVQVQATDHSHSSLVIADLAAEGFVVYTCSRLCVVGVNLSSLAKILSHAGVEDTIELTVAEPMEFLEITITRSPNSTSSTARPRRSGGGGEDFRSVSTTTQSPWRSEYRLHILDIDADHMEAPDDRAPVIFRMLSDELFRICQAYSELSMGLIVDVQEDAVRFSTDVMQLASAPQSSSVVDPANLTPSLQGHLPSDAMAVELAVGVGGKVVGSGVTCLKFATSAATIRALRQTPTLPTLVQMQQPCRIHVSAGFMLAIARAKVLAAEVEISLSEGNPLQLQYVLPHHRGRLRYFLAPKAVG